MSKQLKCIITNMCIIENNGQILVQKRVKNDWPGITFPGGHVTKQDASLIDSVIREVKEETNLDIFEPKLVGIMEYKVNNDLDKYLMFIYKTNKFQGELKASEEGEVFFINKEDLFKYQLSSDLDNIYKLAYDDNIQEYIY